MQSVETDDPSPAALNACSSIQIVKRITTIAANNAQVVCTYTFAFTKKMFSLRMRWLSAAALFYKMSIIVLAGHFAAVQHMKRDI